MYIRANVLASRIGILAFVLCLVSPASALADIVDCNNNGVPDDLDLQSPELSKLTASDAATEDYFGHSVSISGDVAVIGAIQDDDAGISSGSAYIFRWDGANWAEEAKLTASDAAEGDYFGYSVSISGDVAIVGAYRNDDAGTESGSAYIFRWDGANWVEQAKLTASDAAASDYFGLSVSISGDVAVIGARGNDDAGSASGSAYVFRWDGSSWSEEAKLTASDAAANDYFGKSVSISGDVVVVGAYRNDEAGDNSGSAYVFRWSGSSWSEEAKLTASDAADSDYFGCSVSISGDLAVVGANGYGGFGSAYTFQWDGFNWVEQAKLTGHGDYFFDQNFGHAVSISGDAMVIGTIGAVPEEGAPYSGFAYVFSWDGSSWVEQAKLAANSWQNDAFGCSVSISGDRALIGANVDDNDGISTGSTYVFVLPNSQDCNENGVPDECDIASGTSQDVNSNDVPDDCEVDCNNNSVPDAWDISQGTSLDVNSNDIPDDCEDCNNNSVPDAWDISQGTSEDVNGNGIPDDCEDCNNNSVLDAWDISQGTSPDCNTNGVPDECDIASGSSQDCNGNDMPDECDIEGAHDSKLTASDAAPSDSFGRSVSISGDMAVIGTDGDDDAGTNSGSAYVFRRDGANWVEQAKLTASDAAAGDYFGHSVSISGDAAVIGACYDDDAGSASGSAYVFRWDGANWVEQTKLTASDAAAGDYFGGSVSISGDVAVIGAYQNDDAGGSSGSAYVFRWNGANWVEQAKLTASDAAASDYFGLSVSISGDVAVIGARGNDDAGSDSGSAYVFQWNGFNWVEQAKLTASDAAKGDCFGYSVSISGDLALIGAHENDDAGAGSGSAYVFRWDGASWVEQAKLTASDAAAVDYFGESASISGDVAVIMAYGHDDAGIYSGSAYVFRWDGDNWVERSKLLAFDGAGGDNYAYSVSISGDTALIGGRCDDDAGNNSGSVQAFTVPTSEDRDGNGIPDECEVALNGDYDDDGDIDADDFAVFEACVSGPAVPHDGSSACLRADFDNDADVDQSDFGVFQRCLSGDGNPADPDCAE